MALGSASATPGARIARLRDRQRNRRGRLMGSSFFFMIRTKKRQSSTPLPLVLIFVGWAALPPTSQLRQRNRIRRRRRARLLVEGDIAVWIRYAVGLQVDEAEQVPVLQVRRHHG